MEDNIREIIKAEAKDFAEEISTDVMGNLIVHKKGNGKKMMLCAHMDEIGVMATAFDDNGYVRIAPLGGLSLLSMIGKHMVLKTV